MLLCREISFIFHREVPFLATVEIQPDRTEWLPYAEEVIGKSITIRIPLPSRPEPTILKLIRLLKPIRRGGRIARYKTVRPRKLTRYFADHLSCEKRGRGEIVAGSVRGAASNDRPYRDPLKPRRDTTDRKRSEASGPATFRESTA